ncbi:MAG: hypothetical protein NPIRA06_33210 [Nitrospirales bacterium]|nr:MAG: hypothetical protein NPIRA06_33210 [Nitrospirales bacterium]
MFTRKKMSRSVILAGIPLLTLPLLAEAGMSRDRSDRMESGRSHSMEQIIQGEVSKKNGDQITLRASNGERITFRITDETNRLCPEGISSKTSQNSSGQDQGNQSSSSQDSSNSGNTSSSMFGSSSGQDSSQPSSGKQKSSQKSGFAFGDCQFEKGEFVKAKVDEDGNATFVRSMGQNDDNYFQSGRSGDEYFVLPAGQLGGLDISDKDANYSVKSSDGQEIGSVYRVMTNNNGDLTYAIVRKKDGQLISVPWQVLEGAGNKSFKLNVTQNQLGNLPILEEGENAGAHVQKNWDLTEQERQNLAKWNEGLDDRNQVRDRYYEDTPTFRNNREGYDRYDPDRSRMSRSGYDRTRHYQDQNAEDFQTRRKSFSPTEFPPHDRAFQYEGSDRQRSMDRNRQGRTSDDYRNRGNQRSMYSQSREGNSRYDTTAPRSDYNSQRQGYDRQQSRRSSGSDYDYRPDGYRP